MSSAIDMAPATARLEPALRYLVTHSEAKVSAIAARFKVPQADLWAWLGQFNQGKKVLAAHVVDGVKSGLAARKPGLPANTSTGSVRALKAAVARVAGRNRDTPPQLPRPLGELLAWLTAQGLNPLPVTSYQVTVPPELAGGWLTLNQGNRNPSKAKIRRFAAAIKAGKWVLNGETIKFSTSGRLLDGQSRLRAIVEAGAPAVLELRGGLPDLAQQSMDIGETRRGTHMLEMMGEKYPAILSPALRLIYRHELGGLSSRFDSMDGKSAGVLENMEIGPLLVKHAGLKASVGWCVSTGHRIKALMPLSEAAFFHYTFGRASAAKRDGFFTALATGLGLTATHPAYHLRERLQQDRASSKRMGTRERLALTIKAWNAHLGGQKLTTLVFRAVGDNREGFPAIAGVKGGRHD